MRGRKFNRGDWYRCDTFVDRQSTWWVAHVARFDTEQLTVEFLTDLIQTIRI